jgi:hypothetical protein
MNATTVPVAQLFAMQYRTELLRLHWLATFRLATAVFMSFLVSFSRRRPWMKSKWPVSIFVTTAGVTQVDFCVSISSSGWCLCRRFGDTCCLKL